MESIRCNGGHLYADGDSLEQLPASCAQAADELEKDRAIYTAKGVFSDAIIDYLEKYLKTL